MPQYYQTYADFGYGVAVAAPSPGCAASVFSGRVSVFFPFSRVWGGLQVAPLSHGHGRCCPSGAHCWE